jgi:hypothetical protein
MLAVRPTTTPDDPKPHRGLRSVAYDYVLKLQGRSGASCTGASELQPIRDPAMLRLRLRLNAHVGEILRDRHRTPRVQHHQHLGGGNSP